MKRFAIALLTGAAFLPAATLLPAAAAVAQQPPIKKDRLEPRRDAVVAPTAPTVIVAPTPEMWFYEQETRRHDDPKAAVRRNAEYTMRQRMARIESRRWFGYSNSRPIASPNPWYDTYSPQWVSNTYHPYEWSGVGYMAVSVRPGWYGY